MSKEGPMDSTSHPDEASLEATLESIRQSPPETGAVELIVRRPATGQREELNSAELDPDQGLAGDNWASRGYHGGPASPDMQVTLMNSRCAQAVAGSRERWSLAGDQFYVDFDLSDANLPPGTRVRLGSALLEITAEPHLGCRKFGQRFGKHAARFVNSDLGKSLNLRGVNARVIEGGAVKTGDIVAKLAT